MITAPHSFVKYCFHHIHIHIFVPLCNILYIFIFIKKLLDEAEHDIKNYPDPSQCYLAKVDNIDQGLDNS